MSTKLPRTNLSGLDYGNIIEDIKTLIKEDPKYNKYWDNFSDASAGRMLIELFAWIADQLATRIDWVANESFIDTATQKKSIVRLLKLIGYKLSKPKAAAVDVTCIPSTLTNNKIILTSSYSNGEGYAPFSIT